MIFWKIYTYIWLVQVLLLINYDKTFFRREPQKTSVSPPRWRRSRSPGPVQSRDPAYTDKWAPRGASPPRDPVRRDRSPPLERGGASSWDAYGGGPSSRAPQQLQQAGGRLSPIPVSSKRPRSPTPGQDSRYVRRDYPATGKSLSWVIPNIWDKATFLVVTL